eukprot:gene19102-biopygen22013
MRFSVRRCRRARDCQNGAFCAFQAFLVSKAARNGLKYTPQRRVYPRSLPKGPIDERACARKMRIFGAASSASRQGWVASLSLCSLGYWGIFGALCISCAYFWSVLDAKSRRNRLGPHVKHTDIGAPAEHGSHGWGHPQL